MRAKQLVFLTLVTCLVFHLVHIYVHIDVNPPVEEHLVTRTTDQVDGSPPVHEYLLDNTTSCGPFAEGTMTKNGSRLHVIVEGVLRQVSSCSPCGGFLNLCQTSITHVPWDSARCLPTGDNFTCDDPPDFFVDLIASSVCKAPCFARTNIDRKTFFVIDGHKAVRLLNCMECGPLYGNICKRYKNIGSLSARTLQRIGRWPLSTEGKPFKYAPVFECHRDAGDMIKALNARRWFIFSKSHTMFLANLVQSALEQHGYDADIGSHAPESYARYDAYVVIGLQSYRQNELPPLERSLVVQPERGSTKIDLGQLKSALAVLVHSFDDLEFLNHKRMSVKAWHVPLGGNVALLPPEGLPTEDKLWDVLFFGDLRSKRRNNMLKYLSRDFRVKKVSDVFGVQLHSLIKQARFAINIHQSKKLLPLEIFRIMECLSLGVPVISEESSDSWLYPELKPFVHYFELDSIKSMLKVVHEALRTPSADMEIRDFVSRTYSGFQFQFSRVLLGLELLPINRSLDVAKLSSITFPKRMSVPTILSLPETPTRRTEFMQSTNITYGMFFAGGRQLLRANWVSVGLSYSMLASLALTSGVSRLAIAEDDCVFPPDFTTKIQIVEEYIDSLNDDWDMFSGLIADIHPDARILSATVFKGLQFITIDKMTSLVYNIYNKRLLDLMKGWNVSSENVEADAIDRYIERQLDLKVVLLIPYLVGHRVTAQSTLWGFGNDKYTKMIGRSERTLLTKLDAYNNRSVENPSSSFQR
eukprot:TRINITY_DN922_c0_g3_i2.p1 TRINITY_DN922_c0_g3~~TRINITY_DN922_c0_g3_i2.p1  ORF type:complete len:776 (+),score=52.09 TRINITY_DN922_c0_g3_i2:67-2328(+)